MGRFTTSWRAPSWWWAWGGEFRIPAPGHDPEIHRAIQAAGAVRQHQRADRAVPVEPENPLRTAEMTLEDDYGMIDGIINNGRRGEELEKAQSEARRTTPEKKPSIRERLEDAKRECAERKARTSLPRRRSPRSWATYEPEQEMASGMGVLPGRERQASV